MTKPSRFWMVFDYLAVAVYAIVGLDLTGAIWRGAIDGFFQKILATLIVLMGTFVFMVGSYSSAERHRRRLRARS